MTDAPDLHLDIAPFAFLLGTWRGEGDGDYPTIDGFRYGEEMIFAHVREPWLRYTQRSWILTDGSPSHAESGFLRAAGQGRVELTLAHPLGLTEVAEGTVEGTCLNLRSTSVGRTATGEPVTALARNIRVEGDDLTYELEMATEETSLTRHLTGSLRRV